MFRLFAAHTVALGWQGNLWTRQDYGPVLFLYKMKLVYNFIGISGNGWVFWSKVRLSPCSGEVRTFMIYLDNNCFWVMIFPLVSVIEQLFISMRIPWASSMLHTPVVVELGDHPIPQFLSRQATTAFQMTCTLECIICGYSVVAPGWNPNQCLMIVIFLFKTSNCSA